MAPGGWKRTSAFTWPHPARAQTDGHAELSFVSTSDKYSFVAVRDPHDIVRGAFEWKSIRPDGSLASGTGRVICVRITGNVAHIAGVFERADVPWIAPPLNYAIRTVEDNARGSHEAPDRVSLLHPVTAAQAAAHCITESFLALLPNEQGEVLIKDGSIGVSNDD
jgi:hypothetical protein